MYNPLIKEYRGRFGKGRTVDDIVGFVEDLPPMPDVIARALVLVDDVKTSPEEMAKVIMLDPALASPILRSANSAMRGHQREVTTLALAIPVVGTGEIKTILLAAVLRRWVGDFGPVQRLVWEKSIGAASAARVLCGQLKKPYVDELHLSGLLHNLGQFVLISNKEVGGSYPGVLTRIKECNEDFVTAEREIVGYSHPLIGALVAWKWGFPHSACRAILHYNDPFEKVSNEEDEKLGILKLATELGMILGFGRPDGYAVDLIEGLEKLAILVGFNNATARADLQLAMCATKARFDAEVDAYG
jgi:HD-like signal output (HDOD) protein